MYWGMGFIAGLLFSAGVYLLKKGISGGADAD
jgi:hypothetical protein